MNKSKKLNKKIQRGRGKKRPGYFFLILGALLLSYIFLFGNHGLIRYFQLQYRKNELNRQITAMKEEQERLQKEIDMLQNNYHYIEKIAREKYQMGKNGEKIYFMIQSAGKNSTSK